MRGVQVAENALSENNGAESSSNKAEGVKISAKNTLAIAVVLSLILGVFAGYMLFNKPTSTGQVVLASGGQPGISEAAIKEKAEKYITENLLSNGMTVKINSIDKKGTALLEAKLTIYDANSAKVQDTSILLSADGAYLVGGIQDMSQAIPTQEEPIAETTAEVQKSDKPKLELYVMSFCPYGVQAEQALSPVVKLLGSKADIEVKFIVSLSGDTPADVSSLHGAGEAAEDLRQVCINKLYPDKYWNYLDLINEAYSSGQVSASNAADKWSAFAAQAGIDAKAVEACAQADAMAIIKQDNADSTKYGVSGSPTFIINGAIANVSRTPDGIKTAICNAFNTAPAECDQVLTASAAATPTGGCAT